MIGKCPKQEGKGTIPFERLVTIHSSSSSMKNAGDTVSNQIAAIHSVHGNERALSQVGALNQPLLALFFEFWQEDVRHFSPNNENPQEVVNPWRKKKRERD